MGFSKQEYWSGVQLPSTKNYINRSPEVCCFLKWNSLTDETLEVQEMKENKKSSKKKKKKLLGDSEMSSLQYWV